MALSNPASYGVLATPLFHFPPPTLGVYTEGLHCSHRPAAEQTLPEQILLKGSTFPEGSMSPPVFSTPEVPPWAVWLLQHSTALGFRDLYPSPQAPCPCSHDGCTPDSPELDSTEGEPGAPSIVSNLLPCPTCKCGEHGWRIYRSGECSSS